MFSLIPIVNFLDEETDINKNIPVPIYLDDSLSLIKEKLTLYVSETKLMFPPYLAISLSIDSKQIDIWNENEGDGNYSPITILDNLSINFDIEKRVKLIISNLIDELSDGETESFYSKMMSGDLSPFDKFKKKYTNLREDYFILALKIALYKINSIVYSNFEGDIESSMEDVLSDMNKLSTNITSSYKNLGDYISLSKTTFYNNPLPEDFIITNVNYSVDLKRNIDLVKIFNTFELSNEIPFIGIGGQYINKDNPVVRLFKKDGQIVINDKEIKDFYVSENIKKGTVSYKTVKGLMFKLKIPESNSFASILFNDKGVIIINMKPNKKINVVDEILHNKIRDLIIKVRGGINHIIFNLVNLSVNIETESFIDTEQLSLVAKRPSINKFLFELKDILSKEIISLLYKKSYGKDITINVKDNQYSPNSSIVSVLGVKGMWQVITCLVQLSILDNLFYDTKLSPVVKQQLKERSNIKRLKELGVKVKSTNCQKQRQPIIVDPSQKTPELIGDSYQIEYNGNTYICTNDEYPYPGFTNENILCCFKKDQRKKEAYLRNMGETTKIKEKKEIKKHIITTEKLLENGRLGLLPQIFRQSIENILKLKNIFRLGVLQDKNSFLNAISLANNYSDVNNFWSDFKEFINKNKKLLSLYLNVSVFEIDDINEVDFSILDNQKDYLLAISYFTETNYFVFDVDHLDCLIQSITDNYSNYIILLRKDNNWEIVVEKTDGEDSTYSQSQIVTKKLSKDHPLIQFMSEYYDTSCKKIDYYPDSYTYKKLPYLKDVFSNLIIKTQIVNENNKVSFIVNENNALIPVKEENIKLGIPFKWLNEIEFPQLNIQLEELKKLGQDAIGLITKDSEIIGVLSNTGISIPVVPLNLNEYSGDLKPKSGLLGNYILTDKIKWERTSIVDHLDDLRRSFADYLAEIDTDLRDEILKVVTSIKNNHKDKFNKLLSIIPQNFRNKTIINELIVENKFSNILNDNIPSKFIEMKPSYTEEIIYEW